jgi:hypothetical protein
MYRTPAGAEEDRTGTPLSLRFLPSMNVEHGVEPILRAATDASAAQGVYYGPCWFFVGKAREIGFPSAAKMNDSVRLWNVAEQLTGVPTPL